jgi:hypothetical protein
MNVDYLLLYLCLFTIHHQNLCTGSSYEIGYVSFQVYNGICPHSKLIFLNSFFFFCSNGLLLQFVFFLFVYFFLLKKKKRKKQLSKRKKITVSSLPQYCGGEEDGCWSDPHGCISINLECTSSKQKHKKLLYCF